MKRLRISIALLILAAIFTFSAHAETQCIPEIEPNDQAAQAQTLRGDFCLTGRVGERDQDIVIWEVSPADAASSWKIEINGELSRTIQLRVHYLVLNPDNVPTNGSEIYNLRSLPIDGHGKDEEVLFRPGKYVVGILGDHDGTYKLQFSKNTGEVKHEAEPNDEPGTATPIVPGTVVRGDLLGSEDFYRWKVSAIDAKRRWQVGINSPKYDWISLEIIKAGTNKTVATYSNGGVPSQVPDLGLDAGDYILHLYPKSSTSAPYLLRLKPVGPRIASREEEPNDSFVTANPLSLSQPVGGRIGRTGDVDVFSLTVPPGLEGKLVSIKLDGTGAPPRKLCLLDKSENAIPCRSGSSPILKDLLLPPGRQAIQVSGEPDLEHAYTLRAAVSGFQSPDTEIEPNDTTATATEFAANREIHGSLDDHDIDNFRLKVDGTPVLWTFRATGEAVTNLMVTDDHNRLIGSGQHLPGAKNTEATEVYLYPGTYIVTVVGKDGSYGLTAIPSGPPDPSQEREPNDKDSDAHRLSFGFARHGKLPDTSDKDCYRFSLAAPEHVSLELDPPKDGDVSFEIEWGYPSSKRPRVENVTKHTTFDALLEPGDYTVRLRANKPSQESYTIRLNRLDLFSLPADLEPNDSPPQAGPLPPNFKVSGQVGQFSDDDWYTLPISKADSALRVSSTGTVELKVRDGVTDLPSEWDDKAHVLTAKVPAGHLVRLRVRGSGPYHFECSYDAQGPQPLPDTSPLPVDLKVALEAKPIAPYWVRGQRIHGAVSLANKGETALNVSLAAISTHLAYAPTLGTVSASLAPRETKSIPIEIAVAPDAWSGDAVQVSVSARADGFTEIADHARVDVDPRALPLNQEITFPLPKELRGGFNVAWKALGSLPVADPADRSEAGFDFLFDGMASSTGYVIHADLLPRTLTVKFGGNKSWPIAGITLHPQVAGRLYPAEQLADFDLLLSADGQNFETVLSDRLTMLPVEQGFALKKPFVAKAAQLKMKTNHADNLGNVGLSEWKVIASPTETLGISVNLADPERGGHVVRSDPLIGGAYLQAKSIIQEGGAPEQLLVSQGVKPSFVIGFHEDRAALVTNFEWVSEEKSEGYDRFEEVTIEASLDGPIGPWKPIGTMPLNHSVNGTSKLMLPQAEWARFIRFRSTRPAARRAMWRYPIAVRIFERATDSSYLSVLGEWGQFNRDAVYEATQAPPPPKLTTGPYEHGTSEHPVPLQLSKVVTGEVKLDEVDDWYGIDIPAGLNVLGLNLKGDPFVASQLELKEASGKKLSLRVVSQSSSELQYAADVAPGHYSVHVFEPPHGVAIAFDTSPSLADFAPIIFHALKTFAEGVVKNREFVNFIDFGNPFLLEKWSDEAWVLVGALVHFRGGDDDSSDLEVAMIDSMKGLEKRPGSRAIIVVSDAETPTYARQSDMWQFLSAMRPRIFSAQIGLGGDPVRQKQIMQDLASVNGGHYSSARTQAEMDVISERAAAWLRRPARYAVVAEKLLLPPEKPGSIEVKSAPKSVDVPTKIAPKGWGAVELILDASGSMLQRIKGKRKIEIAKNTLTDLVQNTIPAGTQVAYRVFGDDKPGSCETHLRAPLAPLDRSSMTKLFSGIRSINLAKTAIGAALRNVGDDLKNGKGERTVVVITDGEETCGGDPQKEIEKLRASGFDVRINIVGFSVENNAIKDTFRNWAKLGGGNYFDAADEKELAKAMKAAVSLPLKVVDDVGAVVGAGLVDGSAIVVRPGRYSVEVGGPTGTHFNDVQVEPEENVSLSLDGK